MQVIRLSVRENRLRDPTKVTQSDYRRFVAEPGASWVAEWAGHVVGFGIADRVSRSIWALFVDPEFAGRGIGRALLQQVTDYLFALGSEPINLSTEPGTRAERFYLASGWVKNGVLASGESWLIHAAPSAGATEPVQ